MKHKKAPPPIKRITLKAFESICSRRTIVRGMVEKHDISEKDAANFFEIGLSLGVIRIARTIGLSNAKAYQVVKDHTF